PPEQGFGPLDPAGHEVAVRALAERSLEAAGEVGRRHRGRPRKGRHVERPVELAIHAVLGLAQPYEVADVHGNDINGTQAAAPSWVGRLGSFRPESLTSDPPCGHQ